ncbi:hypothetical protein N7491_010246 [Penicillium cf. griseofulvum]|uniref:Uncharacterized protein n=1 Tax=Penicillium cf. griseofulvum TaxID=2972120 RepID=A0A9W9T5N0_9EURO|nr:hypothetical protein N7472_000578 [Penicillium cf. griseofulvum]KAJ5421801.1 hypothetical protein N7491_010246 [Penicillium cf. griseofulvum]KAJ5427991.1 hypothetical protein N7445_009445 [Penicillium cf. griseofulvum]
MSSYLSLPAIADFINAYEDKPTAENARIMVSGLLTYAFDSNDGWVLKWQEDEENNHSNCFIVKATGENRALHAIVKIVLDTSAPIQENWDQQVPRLISAPIPTERCWAILIRGLKVRLYEYHRDQAPDYRLVPCDFKVKDKTKQSVHIRKNVDAVNSVFIGIPGQVPEPLNEGENGSPAANESSAGMTDDPKAAPDDTPVTVPASAACPEPSSENTPAEVSENKAPTKAKPVTERETTVQAKTAIQLDTTASQPKRTTGANGTQAMITTQAKAATQVKPAAGVMSATQAKATPQAKAALLAKGVSGIKFTPKMKPTLRTEVMGQAATDS